MPHIQGSESMNKAIQWQDCSGVVHLVRLNPPVNYKTTPTTAPPINAMCLVQVSALCFG